MSANKTTSTQDNFFVKNIFSIISLIVLIGGFVAGYAKLQVTVNDIKQRSIDKEIIRKISKEVVQQLNAPIQKDIQYIQKDMDRLNNNIRILFRKTSIPAVMMKKKSK